MVVFSIIMPFQNSVKRIRRVLSCIYFATRQIHDMYIKDINKLETPYDTIATIHIVS